MSMFVSLIVRLGTIIVCYFSIVRLFRGFIGFSCWREAEEGGTLTLDLLLGDSTACARFPLTELGSPEILASLMP